MFTRLDSLSILHLAFCSENVIHMDYMTLSLLFSEGAKRKLPESKWMKEPKDMFCGGIQSTRVMREETGARRIITMPLYFHTTWVSAAALPTHRPKRNLESEGLQHLLLNTDHMFVNRLLINLFPNEFEGQQSVSADEDTCAKLDDMSSSLGPQGPCGGKREHLTSTSFL